MVVITYWVCFCWQKYLRDYWNDPDLDRKEQFLRDYILNKGYIHQDDERYVPLSDDLNFGFKYKLVYKLKRILQSTRIPTYDEVICDDMEDSEEEGEMFLEQQEDFERSYNFRFEEPGFEQIKTYPRNISTSVRSKDDHRKRKREEVKERKKKVCCCATVIKLLYSMQMLCPHQVPRCCYCGCHIFSLTTPKKCIKMCLADSATVWEVCCG